MRARGVIQGREAAGGAGSVPVPVPEGSGSEAGVRQRPPMGGMAGGGMHRGGIVTRAIRDGDGDGVRVRSGVARMMAGVLRRRRQRRMMMKRELFRLVERTRRMAGEPREHGRLERACLRL